MFQSLKIMTILCISSQLQIQSIIPIYIFTFTIIIIRMLMGFLLLLTSITCQLIYYTEQQTREIRLAEQNKWNSLVLKAETTQSYSCVVKNVLSFMVEPPSEKVRMGLRGRVFIMERRGRVTEQVELSPMDSSKVYVYSPKGIIVGSAEFYQKFSFSWTAEANQTFKIVFQDGPPGPYKLFVWELDVGAYQQTAKLPTDPFDPSDMSALNRRIQELSFFFRGAQPFSQMLMIAENQSHKQFVLDNLAYEGYLWIEAVVVCLTVWFQVHMIKKLLKNSSGIII